MALGLDVGKVSMAGMYDVTNSTMGKQQTHDYVKFEGIYSTAQILWGSSSKGIKNPIIQYFSNLTVVSELQHLELPENQILNLWNLINGIVQLLLPYLSVIAYEQ